MSEPVVSVPGRILLESIRMLEYANTLQGGVRIAGSGEIVNEMYQLLSDQLDPQELKVALVSHNIQFGSMD